jgi:hypothetical protein
MPGEYAAVVTASNWFNSITATTTVEVIGYRVLLPVLLR